MSDTGQGTPTPGRKLTLQFDFSEVILGELPFAMGRRTFEIQAMPGSQNVKQLANGGWTLKSLQEEASNVQEVTDSTGSTIRQSQMTTDPSVVEVPTQRPATDLPGATTGSSPNIAQGGFFQEKQVGQ